MGEQERPADALWDRLIDFAYNDEHLTHDEVKEELRREGVDTAAALARIQRELRDREARASLAAAGVRRKAALDKLRRAVTAPLDVATQELQEIIRQRVSGDQQLVYFRKLQQASSEQDLKSLAEDLSLLDDFCGEPDAPNTK